MNVDFSKATIEELDVVAYEDDYANVIDKELAICQLMHRQIDIYELLEVM
ncbi:MAG TPA: hypothetical protein IAA29_11965 [Candidatus Paenibacillus intestinavium]|nr:hypothetical protein [Candidatus Paenibacillus intestinavium]